MPGNNVRILASLDDKISSKLDKIQDRFNTLGKSKGAQSILQGVGLGVGAKAFDLLGTAVSSVTDYIGESIKAASDLHESMSKSEVVFGSASRAVEAFGANAADSIGLSKQAAIEASATLGNLFTGIGQTKDAAAGMSTRMVQLAGDLASFNNLDPTDALDKLKSGLSGEAEPLRSVGVFLTEAKVKAKAMQLGLGGAHKELTEGEKVLARYQLILDETSNAQGDFARTSDGLANSTRKVAAEQANLSAAIGEEAQPLALFATQLQLNFVRGAVVVGGALDKIAKAVNESADYFTHLGTVTDAQTQKIADDFGNTASHLDREARNMGDSAKDTTHSVYDISYSFDALSGSSKTNTDKVIKDFADMKDALASDAKDLIDQAFGPLEDQQGELATLSELAAARRIIASKTATKAEKADARDKLLGLGRDNADYVLKLAQAGEAGSAAYKKGIAELKTEIAHASGPTKKALQDVLDKILAVEKAGRVIPINFIVSAEGSGLSPGHKAAGGPVSANTPYLVGEEGPELFVPSGRGDIIPNDKLGSGGGVTVNLTINSIWPPTPQQVRAMADVLDREFHFRLQRAAPTMGRT